METGRHTDRQRGGQTDREAHRQTEVDRQAEGQRGRQTGRQTDRLPRTAVMLHVCIIHYPCFEYTKQSPGKLFETDPTLCTINIKGPIFNTMLDVDELLQAI